MKKAEITIEEKIKTDGIYSLGYGIISKHVICDHDLPIKSKYIYIDLCCMANSKTRIAFPKRKTLKNNVGLKCNDAYKKYMNYLIDKNYIEIIRQKNKPNLYKIVDRPKSLLLNATSEILEKISGKGGILELGYSQFPNAVRYDERLSSGAKVLFAYISVFATNGTVAYTEVEIMLYHLDISKNTYYNYYRELIKYGYISATQRHVGGRTSVNEYAINKFPNSEIIEKDLRYNQKKVMKANLLSSSAEQVTKVADFDINENTKNINVKGLNVKIQKPITISKININRYHYQSISQSSLVSPDETDKTDRLIDNFDLGIPYFPQDPLEEDIFLT